MTRTKLAGTASLLAAVGILLVGRATFAEAADLGTPAAQGTSASSDDEAARIPANGVESEGRPLTPVLNGELRNLSESEAPRRNRPSPIPELRRSRRNAFA